MITHWQVFWTRICFLWERKDVLAGSQKFYKREYTIIILYLNWSQVNCVQTALNFSFALSRSLQSGVNLFWLLSQLLNLSDKPDVHSYYFKFSAIYIWRIHHSPFNDLTPPPLIKQSSSEPINYFGHIRQLKIKGWTSGSRGGKAGDCKRGGGSKPYHTVQGVPYFKPGPIL